MREKIKRYLTELAHDEALQDTTELFAGQFIDSLALLQLVDFIEKEFGIRVEGMEIVQDNFKDIIAIERFVRNKQEDTRG